MIKYSKGESIYLDAESSINIALVKYWGKVHDVLIIPANSSLSITVNKNDLNSHTRILLLEE
jgi:mevalonate pyrophosphate decarboxylase